MNSFLILSLLISGSVPFPGSFSIPLKDDEVAKGLKGSNQTSSAINFLESILQEFNQGNRWKVISSMMPVDNNLDRLWFNVSKLRKLKSAELRVYQDAVNPDCDPKLMIHQNQCEDCELVTSSSTIKEGWLVFNVTKTVKSWIADPDKNQGFKISGGCKSEIELGNRRKELSPLMVCYSEGDDSTTDISSLVRIKRSNTEDNELQPIPLANVFKRKKIRRTMIRNHRTVKKNLADYERNSTGNCGIKSLELNFESIGRDYIVAPKVINFTYCDGECHQSGLDNITYSAGYDHFLIFRALHKLHPEQIPNTFCLPIKFSGIRILYFNMEDKILVKEVPYVNAEECLCDL